MRLSRCGPRSPRRVLPSTAIAVVRISRRMRSIRPPPTAIFCCAIEWLNRLARKRGIDLRQSCLRLARRARREVGRLIHGRGHKQAPRDLRKMRTWAGRLTRDIERKVEGRPDLAHDCAPALDRVRAFLAQKPDDKHEIYARRPRRKRPPRGFRASLQSVIVRPNWGSSGEYRTSAPPRTNRPSSRQGSTEGGLASSRLLANSNGSSASRYAAKRRRQTSCLSSTSQPVSSWSNSSTRPKPRYRVLRGKSC